jgi:hypothetical protein
MRVCVHIRGRIWEGVCREGKQEVWHEEGMGKSRRFHRRVLLVCVFLHVCECLFMCLCVRVCACL